ncbi:unnamed protein product, partial [Amoebophrya sp. A25]|eukprot:GSA25T00010613001.1
MREENSILLSTGIVEQESRLKQPDVVGRDDEAIDSVKDGCGTSGSKDSVESILGVVDLAAGDNSSSALNTKPQEDENDASSVEVHQEVVQGDCSDKNSSVEFLNNRLL